MQFENLKNFLIDEFISWQIKNASFKLDTLQDPLKIPHAQHWIMLESLCKKNLDIPIVKENNVFW